MVENLHSPIMYKYEYFLLTFSTHQLFLCVFPVFTEQCFNDDVVSPCKTEHVMTLKGGGDSDMAYLAFYRAKN